MADGETARREAEGDPSIEPDRMRQRQDNALLARPSTGHRKLAVVMVGLPARGKTYLAKKLSFYLNWMQIRTQVFNLGEYRRRRVPLTQPASFFHPDNKEAIGIRLKIALDATDDMINFLNGGGMVGVLDATNSTRNRRQVIHDKCVAHNVEVFYVESVCDDDVRIEETIMKVKVNLPEYQLLPPAEARDDFKARINFYHSVYESLSTSVDLLLSFLKIVDFGRYFIVNKPISFLQTRIIRYLMNVHVRPRAIYLTRHGESIYNQLQRIGGDSALSQHGVEYSKRLHEFMTRELGNAENTKVWTSSLRRTIQTASRFQGVESFKCLDELDAGECDGFTYEEIQSKYPVTYARREANKYFYRYPRGESYKDVVERLEPLILELEREENVLVVCHQAVCRCLLAYFKNIPQSQIANELPYLQVPLHTVLKITPIAYGCAIEQFPLGPECVNTHRPKLAEPSAAVTNIEPREKNDAQS